MVSTRVSKVLSQLEPSLRSRSVNSTVLRQSARSEIYGGAWREDREVIKGISELRMKALESLDLERGISFAIEGTWTAVASSLASRRANGAVERRS
ncbi:hypothetical protein HZH66_009618 [Vespula vulgaris]|uniref:Uncharacterized protein n=1 Tax=Vespula vulgaris TaxID=7454 RepID=A0A834JLM4_VESVU|nr:hypothetical protein HZH66_009618 [Vespula vulgaris]